MNTWIVVLIILILLWMFSICNSTPINTHAPVAAQGALPRQVTNRSSLISRVKSKFGNITSKFGNITSKFGNKLYIKSKFGGNSLSYSSDNDKINNITDDTVLIFYAPWCGHCKKSMNDFKQATSQGNGKVMMINSDENPDIVKQYSVNGFPTIMKSNGTKYTGGRDASSIIDFANQE